MLLLNREDIHQVFSMPESIEAVKQAFMLYSQGKSEVPLRTNIQAPKHNGTFLFMPAYAEDMDCASLKIVNIFSDNLQKGLPTAPAQVVLIDGTTGIVSAVMDCTYVTQLRTGAATGAAFSALARKDASIGALIGTGGQAATQLEAMLCARPLKEVRIYDLSAERLNSFVERMSQELASYGAKLVAAPTCDDAVKDADVLVTMTPSLTPVFNAAAVKPGCTISCVGAYQPHMQEMDPAILPRASKIYFDSQSAVLAESGDILKPLAEGIITEDAFTGELGNVLLGNLVGRENDDEIIVFETVGIGTQDLMAAKAIYEKAIAAGVGTHWE